MKRTLTNMLRLAFHCNDGAARNGAGCCYNSPEETDPSLRRGSTQCFYVRKFTRKATRISPLALFAMNGDKSLIL